jgi:hypothetical protein
MLEEFNNYNKTYILKRAKRIYGTKSKLTHGLLDVEISPVLELLANLLRCCGNNPVTLKPFFDF